MKYTIVIQCSAERRSLHRSAIEFARAALAAGHEIERLFFYGEGVLIANGASVYAQDETDLLNSWRTLIADYQLDAVVCVAAAIKRGILDEAESQRYAKSAALLPEGFVLSGLGQLVEAMAISDRVVSFT